MDFSRKIHCLGGAPHMKQHARKVRRYLNQLQAKSISELLKADLSGRFEHLLEKN